MKKAGMLFIALIFFMTGIVYAGSAGTGRITGKFTVTGDKPLANGMVFFFNAVTGPPPSPDRYWRVPDEMTDTDSEGKFAVDLPEGKYYIGAIQRGRGKIGPPMREDFAYVSRDSQGKPQFFTVKSGQTVDLGALSNAEPLKHIPASQGKVIITGIEGTILGDDGKPVEGAIVFAYTNPNLMGKPLFVTESTGKDGKYLLRVHEGGKYYLRSRDIYGGGPPVRDGIVGGYGEEAPMAVEVKTGQITKGVDIKVIRFKGRGPGQQ